MEESSCFEVVKYHTRQKHEFLKAYFDIWIENVGKKNKSIPTLEIYDMFAAYGKCKCEENDETWDGTAALAIQCLERYSRPKRLWLNSYNENQDILTAQCDSLKDILNKSSIGSDVIHHITHDPIEVSIQSALDVVDPRFPSIWILDPYAPSQLPWHIVENVARKKAHYTVKGKRRVRRPELFINLITFTLLIFRTPGIQSSPFLIQPP